MIDFQKLEVNIDPFSIYAEMRESSPIYFDKQRQNWNVFRYADVRRVLSDYELFSSQFRRNGSYNHEMPFSASMISSDPPRHRKLRSLVTQAFTPRAVESLAPRIQEIVDEHLQHPLRDGRMDAIHDLGYPLPVIVIAEMLGIPVDDRPRFKVWSDEVVQMGNQGGNIDPQQLGKPAVMEMSAYFINMIEQRRKQPGDDLISGLLAAEVDGEKLELIELLGFCALLLVAGNETTTNLIGNALLTFAQQPDLWKHLHRHPELTPHAIEEVLRFRSPVQSMFRVTKQEVTIAGQKLPAGASLIAWIGSGNHDEEQFPHPDDFVIDRQPNRHLAFGQGIHYCLGAPLARLEARIALTSMLKQIGSITLAPGTVLERLPSNLVYGFRSVPLILS
ncbi:MAG: cytochrome P450 [Anaerolineales bacterium]|jgi:cytochrome P450